MNTKIQQEPAFDLVISSSGLDAVRWIRRRLAERRERLARRREKWRSILS